MPEQHNLIDLLLYAANEHPHTKIIFVDKVTSVANTPETSCLSYAELLVEAKNILAGLQSQQRLATSATKNVILLLEDPKDFIPAFWACVLGGLTPCPLVPVRNDEERWRKHISHIKTMLHDPLLLTTAKLKRQFSGIEQGIELDIMRSHYCDQSKKSIALAHRVDNATPAVLMLTSGSTGNPKAVVLSHANLFSSLRGKNEKQQLTEADVSLNWIAFDHVAALIETHLLPLSVGATQLHAAPADIIADPLMFLRLIDEYGVTMTFAPNFLLAQISAAVEAAKDHIQGFRGRALDLTRLRHIISGGEAVAVDTEKHFTEVVKPYGVRHGVVWPAFGMTETCAGSIYSSNFPVLDERHQFATVGEAVRGLRMRIVDQRTGLIVPEGESGELQLRGPMIFKSYYNNIEATRTAFTDDGWFRTGDVGCLEAGNNEQRLRLAGQSKESIVVNGTNYFSHELETALEQLDGVQRSFVAAFPQRNKSDVTEQLVVAFAPSFDTRENSPRLVRLFADMRRRTVALWGYKPALILPLPQEEFRKSSLGKINRNDLRRRLEAGEFAQAERHVLDLINRNQINNHALPVIGPVETTIADIYAQIFSISPQTVASDSSFLELGGSSLDLLKLKRRLESHFSIQDLPLLTILENPTVRGLAASLSAQNPRQHPHVYNPIVPLNRTGSKTPLFVVHPGVGEILVFVPLAKYFANERSFYALRARGFEAGEKPFSSFAEMVDTYVGAISARQPHGPYAIAGYSYGGAVAFEIAKRLEAKGEEVRFLASFNLPPVIKYRMEEIDVIEGAVHLALFLALVDQTKAHEIIEQLRNDEAQEDAVYAHLINIASPDRLKELDLDLSKFKAWAQLAQSITTLARSYEPSGNTRQISVFYADPLRGSKRDWLENELRRWDGYTHRPNRYIEVPGEHYTLMNKEHVEGFQKILRAELDCAMNGQ